MKKHAEEIGSSVRVGEMSNRSEDDVFTDAVTEFSDSGMSPRSAEQFESTGLIKGAEQKSPGSDIHGIESLKVNETSGEHSKWHIV